MPHITQLMFCLFLLVTACSMSPGLTAQGLSMTQRF